MKAKPIQITEANGKLTALCSDGSIWLYNGNSFESIFQMEKKRKTTTKNNIEEEQNKFYNTLKEYTETYDSTMLRAFYNYWSEPNQAGNKMRCQLEKTWDVKRRLQTWSLNNYGSKFIGSQSKVKSNTVKYDPKESERGLELLKRSGQLREV